MFFLRLLFRLLGFNLFFVSALAVSIRTDASLVLPMFFREDNTTPAGFYVTDLSGSDTRLVASNEQYQLRFLGKRNEQDFIFYNSDVGAIQVYDFNGKKVYDDVPFREWQSSILQIFPAEGKAELFIETSGYEIFIVNLMTTQIARVAKSSPSVLRDYAPNGRYFTEPVENYQASNGGQHRGHLRVVNMTGQDLFQMNDLHIPLAKNFNLRWSPEGTKFAFYTLDAVPQVSVVEVQSQQSQNIMLPEPLHLELWSSDSQWIYGSSLNQTEKVIYQIDLNTHEVRAIATGLPAYKAFQVSADNGWLSYLFNNRLYSINVLNGEIIQLTDSGEVRFYLWTPNSQWLLFTDKTALYRIRPDGTQLTQITHNDKAGLRSFIAPSLLDFRSQAMILLALGLIGGSYFLRPITPMKNQKK